MNLRTTLSLFITAASLVGCESASGISKSPTLTEQFPVVTKTDAGYNRDVPPPQPNVQLDWRKGDWRKDRGFWIQSMRHSVEFFVKHAWDPKIGAFYSEINSDGSRASDKIYVMALSRMIYGLAHTSSFLGLEGDEYLAMAKSAEGFLTTQMVGEEEIDGRLIPYFKEMVELNSPSSETILHVNTQAYGLSGLVALYQVTKDETLLGKIRLHTDSFIRRFIDTKGRGFFDAYSLAEKQPQRTKSYNSTVYVATSFLLELTKADPERAEYYKTILTDLADIVSTKFLDSERGWIIENFDENWNASWREWQNQSVVNADGSRSQRSIGVGGHNTQAAWFLMRVADFSKSADKKRFTAAAQQILNQVLNKKSPRMVQSGNDSPTVVINPVVGPTFFDGQNGGFFDVFQRETDVNMWHTNKAWWQQAEGILAMTSALNNGSLTSNAWEKVRDQAVEFYFNKFIDIIGGGEFPEVAIDGRSLGGAKGQAGKSSYHTVELARYMIDYLQL